jgi:polar amino acid transport system substrate-binding protein/glutamate/aspartate transport system substrate-binding protein
MRLVGALMVVTLALPSWAGAQTLDQIRESGILKIGYREDAAPFSYKNAIGQPAGYTIELCQGVATAIADDLGVAQLALQYVPVTASNRFDAITSGQIDLLCGATTATLSRREVIDFSLGTFIDGGGVLLPVDAPGSFDQLAGKKVGVSAGTTTEAALGRALERNGIEAEVVLVGSHEEGLAKLEAGEISAYFGDQAILIFLAAGSATPDKLKLGEGQFTLEPYALGMRRGDDDFRLAVDRALSNIYRSGEASLIFKNNFGAKAVPSELLRAMFVINTLPE